LAKRFGTARSVDVIVIRVTRILTIHAACTSDHGAAHDTILLPAGPADPSSISADARDTVASRLVLAEHARAVRGMAAADDTEASSFSQRTEAEHAAAIAACRDAHDPVIAGALAADADTDFAYCPNASTLK
jgi:hypothetical protein